MSSGVDSDFDKCKDSLTIGMYLIIPFGSIPHELVTINFGVESKIRPLNSLDAKPPNTTE